MLGSYARRRKSRKLRLHLPTVREQARQCAGARVQRRLTTASLLRRTTAGAMISPGPRRPLSQSKRWSTRTARRTSTDCPSGANAVVISETPVRTNLSTPRSSCAHRRFAAASGRLGRINEITAPGAEHPRHQSNRDGDPVAATGGLGVTASGVTGQPAQRATAWLVSDGSCRQTGRSLPPRRRLQACDRIGDVRVVGGRRRRAIAQPRLQSSAAQGRCQRGPADRGKQAGTVSMGAVLFGAPKPGLTRIPPTVRRALEAETPTAAGRNT